MTGEFDQLGYGCNSGPHLFHTSMYSKKCLPDLKDVLGSELLLFSQNKLLGVMTLYFVVFGYRFAHVAKYLHHDSHELDDLR